MISLNITEAKAGFLDRKAVQRAIGQANFQSLQRVGRSVRTIARNSMEKVGKKRPKPSRPGKPPKRRKELLHKFLYYAFDSKEAAVVIGPAALGSRPVVPGLHEFGGRVTVKGRRRTRKIGDGGEIRLASPPKGKPVPGRPGVNVIYTKLKTAAQVSRANSLNAELYPDVQATYPARPYMAPALAKRLSLIPDAWKNSVRAS